MRVLTVVGVLDVSFLNRVCKKRRNGLLAIVEVHEAPNVTLHICLVASILKLTTKLHHLVTGRSTCMAVSGATWGMRRIGYLFN